MYNYPLEYVQLSIDLLQENAHTRIHKVIRLVKGNAVPKRLHFMQSNGSA